MTLAIYCGSSFGNSNFYKEKSLELVRELSKQKFELVYGGSNAGLMGVVSNEALNLNMNVTGVITNNLAIKEIENKNLKTIYKVDTLNQRKAKMEEIADGFVALPGGFGTLDEMFEVITLTQIGEHSKPCAFFNVNGYYDKLIDFLYNASKEGFIEKRFVDMLIVTDNIDELIEKIKNYQAPKSKWS